MNPKNFTKLRIASTQQPAKTGMFKNFDATELYCPRCQKPVPVRKRLLLVLPQGDKYEYRCAFCTETVGEKMDRHGEHMTLIV
jgi:hypothetical protein